jgi:poly(glycerol-phosphate) alpha-glucosyltransferase
LTIAESLAHGYPVVGFDVSYGLQELIQSGANGYLVPFKATDEMAERVLQVMMDSDLQKKLSANARESSKLYSEARVKELWQALFQTVSSSNSLTI